MEEASEGAEMGAARGAGVVAAAREGVGAERGVGGVDSFCIHSRRAA